MTGPEPVPTGIVTVRPALVAEAPVLAQLMLDAITWGEVRNLGWAFNVLFHRHCITSSHALCYVAEEAGEILGYAVWAMDTRTFHREFVRRYGLAAAMAVVPHLLRPRAWRPLLRGLTYAPRRHPDDPPAEVLSVATRGSERGKGVGRRIFGALAEAFRSRGIGAVKVGTVAVDNDMGNRWYASLGFKLVRTEPFYADTRVNVYILTLR